MDPKQLIKTLELLEKRTEKIQDEIMQIKLDIAANREVAEMKAKLAAMDVKLYVFGSILFLILTGIVGYYFKTHG